MSRTPILSRTACFSILVALSACGGGGSGGSPSEMDDEPTIEPMLSDTTNTTPIEVSLISNAGVLSSEDFTASTQTVSSGTASEAALIGGVNTGLDYVRITDTGAVAIADSLTPTTTGSATYTGQAILFVTDVAAATAYDGIADAEIAVDLVLGTASLDYTDFSGSKRVGLGTEEAHTGGTVSVGNISVSSAGMISGDNPTVTGFGAADFTGATTVVNGRFAGPDSAEIGGVMTSNGTAGTLTSTFAGAK